MLSNRYGARLPLDEIPQVEFEMIKRELRGAYFTLDADASVRMKVRELLECCYECDLNDIFNKKYKIRSNENIIKSLNVIKNYSLIFLILF
jgi:hypothetical protein